MVVAAMQGVDQHNRNSVGFSIFADMQTKMPKDSL